MVLESIQDSRILIADLLRPGGRVPLFKSKKPNEEKNKRKKP
jgi:hypothetical protein